MSNMKPADELLTVRRRIKELQGREEELKEGFKTGALNRSGDFAIVSVTKRKSKRFDRKAAEAELGSLKKYDVDGEAVVVNVEELTDHHAA
jgi:hypothetical protein